MNRKILPAAIGVLVAGGMPAVQADIVLFGHLDQSLTYFDHDNGVTEDDFEFECTTCSIGFKGSEDLGNGLKAIFKLDWQFDMNNRNTGRARSSTDTVQAVTTGGVTTNVFVPGVVTDVEDNSSITDRDQWIGLAGNFGQLRIGTISTTYKSHGAMLDPIYRTALQQRDRGLQSRLHRGAGSSGQGRAENTVRYDSPSWNGLKLAGTYTLVPDNKGNDNGYGGGISYENGGILVFADYITNDTGGDDNAYKLGGKWTYNNLGIFGQYEKDGGLISSTVPGSQGDGADTWFLGANYTLGNSMLYFGFGKADNGDNRNVIGQSVPAGFTTWQLVGVHSMSKRTSIYAGWSEIDCDNGDNDVCRNVGPEKGGEDDKFALGLKHKF